MAKRFTDTNKYKKPFIRGLQGAYKLLWDYLYHDCDHAGIWIVDFEIAQLYLGKDMPVNKQDALKYFNNGETRIIEFDGGKKWLIKPFIEFQYGILNSENRVHNSILIELNKYNFNKGLISSLQGAKEKEQDKDKDKDKVKDMEEREKKFISDVMNFQSEYRAEMLKSFCDYWTEKNKSKTRMKFELEATFEIYKRLSTWANRDKEFNKDNILSPKTYEEMLELTKNNPELWKQYRSVKKEGERKAIFYPI